MSFNIRNYVSDDHIESIGEIARGQANIIQALSLDNSQKDKEIERLNKEKQEEYERFNLMSKFRDKALARELMYKTRIDKAIEYIDKELCNINVQENIILKNELLVIRGIIQGVIKGEKDNI